MRRCLAAALLISLLHLAPASGQAQDEPVIGVIPGGYESQFEPARLSVSAGAVIRFTANGTFGHNLQAVDGSFSAGDLAPGEERAFRAPSTPGDHAFECRFHREQGMVGTLTVLPGTAVTQDPSPDSGPTPSDEDAETPAPSPLAAVLLLCAIALALRRLRSRPPP